MARFKLREIAAAASEDPKQAVLDAVGDLSGLEVFHNNVLVGTYIAPEKTPGGIIRPDRNIEEDHYQGKVGLVLKLGPLAFRDDNIAKFGGVTVNEGDWVWFRPGDTMQLTALDEKHGGSPLRLIEDTLIKGRVKDPGILW